MGLEARLKLWRLTLAAHVALDGAGTVAQGGRYSPRGVPVVNFASEAALAVLIAQRYLSPAQRADPATITADYVLGWTEIAATPLRIDDSAGEDAIRRQVAEWLAAQRSLLAAVPSKVLPEADVVLMNPAHPDAAKAPPLTTRAFSFAACLHRPPMLDLYEVPK